MNAELKVGSLEFTDEQMVALRRYRQHFKAGEIRTAVRANWDHPDRYVRKAAADLIAELPAAERAPLVKAAKLPAQESSV